MESITSRVREIGAMPPRRVAAGLLGLMLLLAALSLAVTSGRALASSTQETLFQDDGQMFADPAGTLAQLKQLGVDRVRLGVRWVAIAPRPYSHKRPPFKSVDPAAYPANNWAVWDQIVREAASQGLVVDFDVIGGAPLWATAPGAPNDMPHTNWMPSAREFGAFVHALGTRYSGDYDPMTNKLSPGNPDDLPAVRFWSIWNEPDYGPSLAPQGAPNNVKIERSPWMYRNLVDAAWTSLHRTGHGSDTILFGEVAPRGYPSAQFPHLSWGIFSGMKPLHFLQMLYCVDSGYHELRGVAAALRGCPATAAGSRRFRGQHPALFKATGFADHFYSRWYPPNVEVQNDPEYTSLADVRQLTRGLDRLNRVYGSNTRFPIWNTEYGYVTSPPKRSPDPQFGIHGGLRPRYLDPSTAAYYDNWAEYISWRNPRIRSFAQYLLADPLPRLPSNDFGGFASGLLTFAHKQKPAFGAFRLPVYLPVTTARQGGGLEVWGCARPSKFAPVDPAGPQTVAIQLKSGNGPFTTVQTVTVTNPRGYFDTQVVFAHSGTVRLMWAYPPPDPTSAVFSRPVHITVR